MKYTRTSVSLEKYLQKFLLNMGVENRLFYRPLPRGQQVSESMCNRKRLNGKYSKSIHILLSKFPTFTLLSLQGHKAYNPSIYLDNHERKSYYQHRQYSSSLQKNVRKMSKSTYANSENFEDKSLKANDVNGKGNQDIDNQSDDEDVPEFKAALSAITPNNPSPSQVDVVPGKGPPPEPPVNCCMSGCANCVWIQYAEELRDYFSAEEGNIRAKEAIEKIDNPGLQMFLKLELGLL